MTVGIDALIVLLDSHPEWRFFNRFGEEYVYDSKKAMFRYDGWDHYNDWAEVRIRNLRTPRRLLKRVEAPYMYKCAAVKGDTLRLWRADEWGRDEDPELTLKVVTPVDLERAWIGWDRGCTEPIKTNN